MLKAFFFLPFEALNRLVMQCLGFQEPPLQTWAVIVDRWKRFRRIKVVDTKLTGGNGYLYWERTYEDGSKIIFR